MKDIINETLKNLSLNSNAKLNSENGRKFITNEIIKAFTNKHIVFYTDLDKHNEENKTIERGL
tara:strand:+ start:308 stop:496 length:189 start_codon:yes stop_codon:yes gene_type:complete